MAARGRRAISYAFASVIEKVELEGLIALIPQALPKSKSLLLRYRSEQKNAHTFEQAPCMGNIFLFDQQVSICGAGGINYIDPTGTTKVKIFRWFAGRTARSTSYKNKKSTYRSKLPKWIFMFLIRRFSVELEGFEPSSRERTH